jgi:hypothetical protein
MTETLPNIENRFYQEVEDVRFRIDTVYRLGMSLLDVTFKYRRVIAVFRGRDLSK